jgi:hypothetical protein
MTRLEREAVEYQDTARNEAADARYWMETGMEVSAKLSQRDARIASTEAKWRLAVLVNLPGHMDEGF